jgi:hypothetical protein
MRWNARSVTRLLTGAAVATVVAVAVPSQPQGAAPTTYLVSFTIDTFPGARVNSDLSIAYADYRLPLVDGDARCIEASPESTGHLHAVFNRRVDDDTRCNPNGSDRQYRLRLDNAPGACKRLWEAYGLRGVNMDVDLQGCELFYTDNPRVRVADLFKKGNPPTTPVAFLSGMFPANEVNGRSYEIRMLEPVAMSAPNANTRIVDYAGQAYLFEFGNGKAKAVEAPFDLPFRMTFVRTPQ